MLASLKQFAQRLKGELSVLTYAQQHPDTPWYAKVLILSVVAYALSPIDLIPDFIPVLGLLDDLILLPLGIYLALKLIPKEVTLEARERAREAAPGLLPWWGAGIVVALWVGGLGAFLYYLLT